MVGSSVSSKYRFHQTLPLNSKEPNTSVICAQMLVFQYYLISYFLNIDQNERLVRYGVTHVGAADGFSGKILNIVTMPLKNPIVIYDTLYR